MPQLYELSVAKASAAIDKREISPVALVQALIERIDATEPKLEAWAYVARDQALQAALAAERDLANGAPHGPLFGVPFAAKDIFDSANIPTEAGSDHYRGRVPTQDSAPIARLKRAGAILLGKVQTTEFADGHPAPTKNPYKLEHSPGGSSAGSAAAVASRGVPAALGSQTVGSVLRPASFCGVVGIKPTFGRVSRTGVIPYSDSLDHVGVMARTVEDVALMLQALAGFDPTDPHLVNVPVDNYAAAARSADRAPRIGLLHYHFENADDSTRESAWAAIDRMAKAGAEVDELVVPVDFDATMRAHRAIQSAEMVAWHRGQGLMKQMDRYKTLTRAALENGLAVSGTDYYEAEKLRQATREQFRARLHEVDVLISPTTKAPAPALSEGFTGEPAWQSPWTFIGFPAITLPCGQTAAGLPMGLQLGATAWQEAKLLNIAAWVEKALGVDLPAPAL